MHHFLFLIYAKEDTVLYIYIYIMQPFIHVSHYYIIPSGIDITVYSLNQFQH